MTKAEQKKFYVLLGERIKEARTISGLKQEAFANFLSLSRASIVNIEKGRQRPSIHLLWDIAKVLDIEVSSLLPQFSPSEKLSEEWKKIIAKQSKGDNNTKEKLLGFLEEVQSSKTT